MLILVDSDGGGRSLVLQAIAQEDLRKQKWPGIWFLASASCPARTGNQIVRWLAIMDEMTA